MANRPNVSVIVPCLNEAQRILHLLDAVYSQTYPIENISITIADGGSKDNTRQVISDFATLHPRLSINIVDNPATTIPTALNTAIRSSKGEIILRLDAHSAPYPNYIELAVNALLEGKGDNVGGVWDIKASSDNWISRAISVAAGHPVGVGNARYRHTNVSGYVDTVPFGCFYRTLIDKIGYFDETMLTNEDYEFNVRIRQAGGKIWLDPAIKCVYYSRPSLPKLLKQYFRYGYWKYKMLKNYPATILFRQALPPIFVASILLGLLFSIAYPSLLVMVELVLVAYFLSITLFGVREAIKRSDPSLILGFPLSVAVMHISWGSGFLWSILF